MCGIIYNYWIRTLEDIGYTNTIHLSQEQTQKGLTLGRVTSEHKERYIVFTAKGEVEAEVTGNMRYSAKSREDFPAVGDWVGIMTYDNKFAIIHSVLPRVSIIKRQVVGQFGEVQVIAANIDFAFLVQAVDRDFSINRLERYLTICHASNVTPIIVLTKSDLLETEATDELVTRVKERIKNIILFTISNNALTGYDSMKAIILKGKTYCMMGSSGVGKSTLLNNLSGKQIMRTDSISHSTSKGKHVTSHRELIVLPGGGILIDTPGMREVGIIDSTDGLETTFDAITKLSQACKYKDCGHTGEIGCAVREAVEKGELSNSSYETYLKMEREKAHFESSLAERKKKDKELGKIIKDYKKTMRKNRL